MRFDVIAGVARAELRLVRRLVRYWIFTVLAALLAIASYAYYAFLHHAFSAWSASVASITPRFLVALLGLYYVFVMLLGLVFLGFDLRARDVRERMSEVLDTRPCSNLELLAGKFLGLLVAAWIPVVVVALVVLLVGLAIDEPVEPWSLAGYVLVLVPPALAFGLGLVFLVTLLVRHRAVAAVVLLALIFGLFWLLFLTPMWRIGAVDVLGAYAAPFPSDLTPRVTNLPAALQRLGVLLAGLGLVGFAAAVHPRRDDGSRRAAAVAGTLLVAAGVALASVQPILLGRALARRDAWRAAHDARRGGPAPDVRRLAGTARIDPGREIALDLALEIEAPAGAPLAKALFTLNPGLVVERSTSGTGSELRFEQRDGLLEIDLGSSLAAGERTTLGIAARGRPDPWFSYLDSVKEPLRITPWDGQIFLLGVEPLIFERRHVALLPGVRWLPQAGADTGRGDPEIRPEDLFEIDLEVELPERFLAAGPGQRRDAPGAAPGRVRYRFAPGGPVPGAALVAGRFERRAAEIDGVVVEALLHPEHAAAFDVFDEAAGELRTWLTDHLHEAARVGLPYPYDGLTLVEVPGALRGYGGGWRMDTTLGQPGVVLVREAGFPTARFDTMFDEPEKFSDQEGGVARAKRDALLRFFENDFNGGNPFVAGARSFFGFVTAARGDAGLPLDYVLEELSNRLVTGQRGYFSVHLFTQQAINQTVGAVIVPLLTGQAESVADQVIGVVTSRVQVWDTILGVSLDDLDPWADPRRTIDVLTLKGGAMARSLLDSLGRERAGRLVGALRERTLGRSYARDDVLAAGLSVGEPLESWLGAWIDDTRLPGFVCDDVRLYRLSDAADGTPRYQLAVRVRNGEPTPGLVRLDYRSGEGPRTEHGSSDPVLVPASSELELGLVTASPPRRVSLSPYLSLNRGPLVIALPEVDSERIVPVEPFHGVRAPAEPRAPDPSIVADDLDPSFEVEQPAARGALRLAARGTAIDTDQGLPVQQPGRRPREWSRRALDEAWGRYRRTAAVVRAGEGERRAIFGARVPRAGRWRLDYHVPRLDRTDRLGRLAIAVVDAAGSRHDLALDAGESSAGWQPVDTLELPAGDVRIEVSDDTDGRIVVADAVRLAPA